MIQNISMLNQNAHLCIPSRSQNEVQTFLEVNDYDVARVRSNIY